MSYNHYGGNPYGAPPGYGGYGNLPPGMGAPPGLGPPPGMPSAPGMGAPPGMAPPNPQQANRAAGLPASFQPPANMPNINFNAPVIRLGTGTPTSGARGEGPSAPSGGRPGMGMERGGDQGRDRAREASQMLLPPTQDEKLRTVMFRQIPQGVGGDEGAQKICNAVGRLRKYESAGSLFPSQFSTFGFALFDDHDSVSIAIKLLREETIQVPVKKQQPTSNPGQDDSFAGIDKTELKIAVDETTMEYQAMLDEGRGEDADFQSALESARQALKQVQRELFYPPVGTRVEADGDAAPATNDAQGNVEVVNIPIAQEDELADIPAEMREIVAKEIAAFRDRSNQRDQERLRREEEIGARFRQQNESATSQGGTNNIPLGPRGSTAAPSRGQNGNGRGVSFTNGLERESDSLYPNEDDEDTDASDNEVYRRKLKKKQDEEHKLFIEKERKWLSRERSRQLALDREQERERQEAEELKNRRKEQFAREMAWDDDVEARRKAHQYYSDHAAWARERAVNRQEEERRDEQDRREEEEERRREQAQLERARGQADLFLDRQDEEIDRRQAAAPAPQPFKLSLGAAAQRAQASRAMPQRRTIAEVEGLLDDEDAEPSTRRQLIPIQMDAVSGPGAMSEEEISQAVRALAQEIPSDKDGLWNWPVKWDFMDETIMRDRLRPFVEKKIVEYLGVQEEMLVSTVEDHLGKHGTAGDLVAELEGALDDAAEDLVKKLWRMVIFFTECEKRNLPT
ncbi:hypothetical protein HIM_06150 [Hirsutella minnesotensis 3608]|uniref:PWI domain-containing protein n=1 Tax=Hirsutella minnesotensis 3608 TaxID=1043627 RepID=A0A0F8A518_9HYPO|nr:hypothetical protein HIM_06150 [Hirsutella minnesotensis 3608]